MTQDERDLVQMAFQQAMRACTSKGIPVREIKEYLREVYGFGTVGNPPQEQE